ncbi:MAG TPA: DUF1571 domain-containing protein [Planctomycetaceae bacterium]|nr:DUF1571 domain-containing protein [Planctomycetaceae bacterium]
MPCIRSAKSPRNSNLLAIIAFAVSLGAICCSFDPVPAGDDIRVARVNQSSTRIEHASDVPYPPGYHSNPSDSLKSVPTAVTSQDSSNSAVRNNGDAIKFSMLLLKDGGRFIENVHSYRVLFDKRERISGDIGDTQTLELKVRHAPAFSVYMKWKNGDKGRQLLYNEAYEDKQMVVKLGGLKGRILPALKLDPFGSEAHAEARYPVTEAGLAGMIRQIVIQRELDLNLAQGVVCTRLENQVFDERECYCFRYDYSSTDASALYRKSFVYMDTRYHLPLKVTNYTWSSNGEGLTPEQLDEMTLIEDYSFRELDMGTPLAERDFSRENPSYRM